MFDPLLDRAWNSPGFCDNFRVFRRPLTAAEIAALYNSGAELAGVGRVRVHDPLRGLGNAADSGGPTLQHKCP